MVWNITLYYFLANPIATVLIFSVLLFYEHCAKVQLFFYAM